MRSRGFTLIEIMLVVAVIGVGGSLAVFAMSDQVSAARARSDELGMFLKIKGERDKARERMRGVTLSADGGGHVLVFHKAVIAGSGASRVCSHGAEIERARFKDARLETGSGVKCLDENGLPVGTFAVSIVGDDGKSSAVSISASGQIESVIGEKSGQSDDGAVDQLVELDHEGPG